MLRNEICMVVHFFVSSNHIVEVVKSHRKEYQAIPEKYYIDTLAYR